MADTGIARVLVKRLNNPKFSFNERLKTSKRAFCKGRLPFFSGTEVVVIDWIVQQLDGLEVGSRDSEVISRKLWRTLCDALGSVGEVSHSIQWQNLSWTNLVQVLTKWLGHFSEETSIKVRAKILKCCKQVVTNPVLRAHAFRDLKDVIPLFSCVLQSMVHGKEHFLAEGLEEIAAGLVELGTSLYKPQNKDTDIFREIFPHLLKPFKSLLIKVDGNPGHVGEEVFKKLKDFMTSLIFQRLTEDIIKNLDLNLREESDDSDKSNVFLFLMLHPQSVDGSTPKPCRALIPFVLENTFSMFKRLSDSFKFKLFLSAARVLGFNHRKKSTAHKFNQNKVMNKNFVDDEETFATLHVLLKSLCRFPSVMRATSPLDDIDAPRWIGLLMETLMMGDFGRCQSWYGCLNTLMEFDVLLVTPRVAQLLKNTLAVAAKDDQLAEIARGKFLISLLETYSRLSQLTSLVSKIISLINSPSTDLANILFPPEVFKRYGELCIRLPPMSTMEIINCLKSELENLKANQLEGVKSTGSHIIVDLLRHTIMNAQLVGVAMPKVVLNSLVDTTRGLLMECINPLVHLTLKNHPLLAKVLLLAHGWGELHLVLLQYQPSYRVIWGDHMCNTFVLPHFDWAEDVFDECETSDHFSLKYACALLTVQKLKFAVHQHGGLPLTDTLKLAMSSFVGYLRSETRESWDGYVSSINKDNFSVAIFKLISDNFPVCLPHMSGKDVDHLTRVILCTADEVQVKQSNKTDSMTQAEIARELFESSNIQESIVFLTAIVTNVVKKLADSVPSNYRTDELKHVHSCMTRLSTPISYWLKFVDTRPGDASSPKNAMWECIEVAGSDLTASFSETKPLPMKSWDLETILACANRGLDLLLRLPLEYLLMGNQTRCLMSAFAMLNVILRCPEMDVQIMEIISKIQFVIHSLCDGLRSVWLLSFVQPKAFLLWVYSSAMKVANNLLLDLSVSLYEKHQQTCQGFFSLILQQFTRDHNSCMEIGPFIAEVDWQVVPFRECSSAAIMLASSMMLILLEAMERSPRLLESCSEYFTALADNVMGWLKSFFDQYGTEVSPDASTNASAVALLYCFGVVFHFHSKESFKAVDQKEAAFKETLKEILPQAVALSVSCFDTFKDGTPISERLYFICELLIQREKLQDFVSETLVKDTWLIFIQSVRVDSLSKYEKLRFKELSAGCSDKECSAILDRLSGQLQIGDLTPSSAGTAKLAIQGLSTLLKWKFCRNVKVLKTKEVEIFRCSHMLLHQLSEVSDCQSQLHLGVDILHLNKILVNCLKFKSKYVSLCLTSCVIVDLTKICDDATFFSFFEATYELLNTLLVNKKEILGNMTPAFMCAVHQLTHSVVDRGQSHLLSDALPEYKASLFDCAEKIQRMFALVAEIDGHDFNSFAVNTVADYVSYSEEAVLNADVKKRLDNGAFELMNLLNRAANESLLVSLKATPLEKFKILHGEFEKYHRFEGKI